MRFATCVDCGSGFDHPTVKGPLPQRCGECRAERKRATDAAKSKRWREANPELQRAASRRHHEKRQQDPGFLARRRDYLLQRTYGLSRDEFNDLVASQNGVCAICGGQPNGPGQRLHVDHDHDTGRVRGALCAKCNTAIGLLDDSADRAVALAMYLTKFDQLVDC